METIRLVNRVWNLAFTMAHISPSVICASANQFVSMYALISGGNAAGRPLPLIGRFPFTT
jgi:hypothetical protein